MQTPKTHWPSILILIILGFGVFVFLLTSLTFGITSIVGLLSKAPDPAGGMIRSFASGLETIILLFCAWNIFQKTINQERADDTVRLPSSLWHLFAIPAVILLSITIGAGVTISEIRLLGWLFLPILTILTVALPILLFLGIGVHGLDLGTRWRAWSTLAIGMTVSPAIIILLEIVILVIFALTAGIYLITQPQIIQELEGLTSILNQGISDEAAIKLLAPYIDSPATIASIFLFLSLIVPLIEEGIKPLAVWIFARRLESPASGFALGILSGAAFALVESLNVSADGSPSWILIVTIRSGTSLLHITGSGLMGFAIVQLFQSKKWGRFILTYLAIGILHGIWNACAAGTALATIGGLIGRPEWMSYLPAALCGISVLIAGMFAVLIASNRRLRNPAASQPSDHPGADEGRGKIPS